MRRLARLALVAPTALLTGCSASTGHASSGAPVTTAANAGPLEAAARTMASATSYRFLAAITTSGATTRVAGEFQAPDRIHEVITPSTGSVVETVFIGRLAFVHDSASGRWLHAQQAAAASTAQDPRLAFSVLEQADHVRADGPTYRFSLPAASASRLLQASSRDAPSAAQGTATVSDQGITHLEFELTSLSHQVQVVLDYLDMGRGPPVSQPERP
jgi:hypothetical protein